MTYEEETALIQNGFEEAVEWLKTQNDTTMTEEEKTIAFAWYQSGWLARRTLVEKS